MKLEGKFESISIGLVGVLVLLVVANQAQISSISGSTTGSSIGLGSGLRLGRGTADLASVDINEIRSTAQGIATLFPVEKLSMTLTDSPSLTSLFAMLEPIKPAPPVIRKFIKQSRQYAVNSMQKNYCLLPTAY